MADWKAIASAPYDTPVLVSDPFEGVVVGVRRKATRGDDYWMPIPTSYESDALAPTHWAERPTPPDL